MPKNFELTQNYPNPFNSSSKIKFTIPIVGEGLALPERVTLKVFDILANEVSTLVDEEKPVGSYEVTFHTENKNLQLTSGVYIYRLQINDRTFSKKMLLLP